MSRKLRYLFALLILTLFFLPIYSEAIKIASWNILYFPGSTGLSREDDFRKVVGQLNLDILVIQEMASHDGVNEFLNNVMNYSSPGTYAAAPFFDGPDTDNAMFYKKSILNLYSRQRIPTTLRDISEYVMEIIDGPGKGTFFRIYSVHLKAGTSVSDKDQRTQEANTLRNYLNGLPPNSLFLVCGDFNLESSNESAFGVLTSSQADNDGRVKDPIIRLGDWNDNLAFADIHTQSTRAVQFGGGASGGLDDRFDLILISYAVDTSSELIYTSGSYHSYGNDGKHFNKSVNDGINEAVGSEIANALYEASDHLPVIIELNPPTINYTLTINTSLGGTTNPSPGSYSYAEGTQVTITAIPSTDYEFKKWTEDVPGGHENDNPLVITMDGPKNITANFRPLIPVTVTTSPEGLQITVDVYTYMAPQAFSWKAGTTHSIGVNSPQSGGTGKRYIYSSWSDGGSQTHNITTPSSATTYTASFATQYSLMTLTNPTVGGTVIPSGTNWFNSGQQVQIQATANPDYSFTRWSGDLSGTTNPITITMDSSKSITAYFIRIIYPPLQLSGQKVLNRSLSQAEYVNVLKWNLNPDNEDIIKYRIYQIEGNSQSLLAEVSSAPFRFQHRKVDKNKAYTYSVLALNNEDREGEPAYVTVK